MALCAMTKPDIWYVAFVSGKARRDANGRARATRTFKSEVDAKLFAMQILAKGWTASAGTLNPYQPKQCDPGIADRALGRSRARRV